MKSNKIDPIEVKGTPERRVKKGQNYILRATANLTVIFAVAGLLASIYFVSYLGIQGGLNEMERQNCESYQAYLEKYPESSIRDEDITRCGKIGIEIK